VISTDIPQLTRPRSPWRFFVLVFALTIPFWLVSAAAGIELLPGLPLAAFAVVCPTAAALFLVFRDEGRKGAIRFLSLALDFGGSWVWYLPVILIAPCVAAASFAAMRLGGVLVPTPQIPGLGSLLLFVLLLVAALAEELGWSGYALEPLQRRWGALTASLMLGSIWAVWHYIPLLQVGRSVEFIGWWTLGTLGLRVTMVWLYNSSGKSVFAVSLFHAMSNLSWQLFPIRGSYFDPRIHGLTMALLAASIVLMAGSRDLRKLRGLGSYLRRAV
jgi:uncharacterized protein